MRTNRRDGAADLHAARDLGAQRLRRRRVTQGALFALVLIVTVGGWLALESLDSGSKVELVDSPDPSPMGTFFTQPPPTQPPPMLWTAPADDPTQPSPAAVAVDREQRIVPDGLEDCGVHVRTSGWPTTVVFNPAALDCIVVAAAEGTPAQFVSTARDFVGGMAGTRLRVVGPGAVDVWEYRIDSSGTLSVVAHTTCAVLEVTEYPIVECG